MPRRETGIIVSPWATTGDVQEPSDVGLSRDTGWPSVYEQPRAQGGKQPERRVFNKLFNELFSIAADLNEQGLLNWDTRIMYVTDAYVSHGGRQFKALRANINVEPGDPGSILDWAPVLFTNNGILTKEDVGEKNIQSNWQQSDASQPDFIRNKPTVPAQLVIDTTRFVPTGAMLPFGGGSAPTGFLLCDGTLYQASQHRALFNVIGHRYTPPAEAMPTQFRVPNFANRLPIGQVTSDVAPRTKGTHQVVISTNNLPQHKHNVLGNKLQHIHGLDAHTHSVNIDHTHGTPNHGHGEGGNHTHRLPPHSHGGGAHTHSIPAHGHAANAHVHAQGSHQHTYSIAGVAQRHFADTSRGAGRNDFVININPHHGNSGTTFSGGDNVKAAIATVRSSSAGVTGSGGSGGSGGGGQTLSASSGGSDQSGAGVTSLAGGDKTTKTTDLNTSLNANRNIETENSGGGQAINHVPASISVQFIIKT